MAPLAQKLRRHNTRRSYINKTIRPRSLPGTQEEDVLYQPLQADSNKDYAFSYIVPDMPMKEEMQDAETANGGMSLLLKRHQDVPEQLCTPSSPDLSFLDNMSADLLEFSLDPLIVGEPSFTALLNTSPLCEVSGDDQVLNHWAPESGDSGLGDKTATGPCGKGEVNEIVPWHEVLAEDYGQTYQMDAGNAGLLHQNDHQAQWQYPEMIAFSGRVTRSRQLTYPEVPVLPYSTYPEFEQQDFGDSISTPARGYLPVSLPPLPAVGPSGTNRRIKPLLPRQNDINNLSTNNDNYPDPEADPIIWDQTYQQPLEPKQSCRTTFTYLPRRTIPRRRRYKPKPPKHCNVRPHSVNPDLPVFATEALAHQQYIDSKDLGAKFANKNRRSSPEVRLSRPHVRVSDDFSFGDEPRDIGFGMNSGRNQLALFGDELVPRLKHSLKIDSSVLNPISTFPDISVPVPAKLTLQEICAQYPNHVWGKMLRIYLCEGWVAKQIWEALPRICRISKARERQFNKYQQHIRRQMKLMYKEETGMEWDHDKAERLENAIEVESLAAQQAQTSPNSKPDRLPSTDTEELSNDMDIDDEIWRSTMRTLNQDEPMEQESAPQNDSSSSHANTSRDIISDEFDGQIDLSQTLPVFGALDDVAAFFTFSGEDGFGDFTEDYDDDDDASQQGTSQ